MGLNFTRLVCNFYPHPLRERATQRIGVQAQHGAIYIHALREEGDDDYDDVLAYCKAFLSTPSARRATPLFQRREDLLILSIHALREEGDDTL